MDRYQTQPFFLIVLCFIFLKKTSSIDINLLQAVAKHIYGTLRNSSVVVSNLVGPIEPMVLANHPVKGLYFTMTGGPEVTVILIEF